MDEGTMIMGHSCKFSAKYSSPMSRQSLLLLLLVVGLRQLATAVEVVESQEEPTHDDELVIDVVEMPSTCDRVSQNGNLLKVHYTGYLASGTEFDTR